MSTFSDAAVAPLNGPQILARLAPVDGIDSGLDADLVRGRAMPTSLFRLDLYPALTPPPLYGDATPAAYIFGA